MAKRKTDPKEWFVTQQEFKQILYVIAKDLTTASERITALESELSALKGQQETAARV